MPDGNALTSSATRSEPYCYKGNGQWYLSAGLSKKSVQRLKAKVANLLTPGNHDPWLDVRDALNGFLFGWARYFSYGTHRRHSGVSTITSMSACADSSRDGTR